MMKQAYSKLVRFLGRAGRDRKSPQPQSSLAVYRMNPPAVPTVSLRAMQLIGEGIAP